jgi:hypothetical protein
MENTPNNKETRSVAGFTGFQFKGVGKIELTQGDHDELVIEAAPDICSRVHTDVREGILIITYDADWMDWTGIRMIESGPIIFHLMMKEIKSLGISGVGTLDAAKVETDNLRLALSGPGSMTIGTLKTTSLKVELSGVGAIDVAGTTVDQDVNLSGAGNFKSSRLESVNTTIKLSGVGNATVWVKETMDVSISGAGAVEYYGSPKITQKISGLGVLKYLGNR